jgi:hypothetical protein
MSSVEWFRNIAVVINLLRSADALTGGNVIYMGMKFLQT